MLLFIFGCIILCKRKVKMKHIVLYKTPRFCSIKCQCQNSNIFKKVKLIWLMDHGPLMSGVDLLEIYPIPSYS